MTARGHPYPRMGLTSHSSEVFRVRTRMTQNFGLCVPMERIRSGLCPHLHKLVGLGWGRSLGLRTEDKSFTAEQRGHTSTNRVLWSSLIGRVRERRLSFQTCGWAQRYIGSPTVASRMSWQKMHRPGVTQVRERSLCVPQRSTGPRRV